MKQDQDLDKLTGDLESQLAEAHERLAELRDARRPYALDAVAGKPKAREAIAEMDNEMIRLTGEIETLGVALEEVERQKIEHEAKTAADARRRKEAEATALSAEILAKDRDIDEAIAALAEALSVREQLVRKLAAVGVVYAGAIRGLQRKRGVTGALLRAGIQRYASIELVGPDARKPLEETDKFLRKPMLVSADEKPSAGEATIGGSAA